MRSAWLLRGGDVLASAEIAETFGERARGLSGHHAYHGALVLPGTRWVQAAGTRFALDLAFLDVRFTVVATARIRPWSVAFPKRGCCHVIEAQAGTFERWHLVPGDQVEIRETA